MRSLRSLAKDVKDRGFRVGDDGPDRTALVEASKRMEALLAVMTTYHAHGSYT